MQLSILSKLLLFLSSYSLLFIALTFQYEFASFTWIFVLLALLGIAATFIITKTKINPDSRRVLDVVSKNEQVLSYLVTYLLPFVGFDLTKGNEIISLFIIFFTIGILYIKADLIFINPLLILFGYNIYEVQFTNSSKRILISKTDISDLKIKKDISFYELQDRTIIIEKTKKKEHSCNERI